MSATLSTQWYWSDWMSEPTLRACGYAARGLWKDMLCIAGSNKDRDYGFVTLNGNTLDAAGIAKMTGGAVAEVELLIAELEKNGVFSRDRRRAIYCRRMVRAQKNRRNGRAGGNPKLMKKKDKPNPVNLPARVPSPLPLPLPIPSKEDSKRESRAGARRALPQDFQLTIADNDYARQSGLGDQIEYIFAAFCDHHRSHGKRMADWHAAWRTWVRNEIKFNPRRPGAPKGGGSVAATKMYMERELEERHAADASTADEFGTVPAESAR